MQRPQKRDKTGFYLEPRVFMGNIFKREMLWNDSHSKSKISNMGIDSLWVPTWITT